MDSLTDLIERFIEEQLHLSREGAVMIRRNRLAEQFRCAPSQVSYVLETRFTMERGYRVETRRGGAGYVRIYRIESRSRRKLASELMHLIGGSISEERATQCLMQLRDKKIISTREYGLMRAAVSRQTLILGLAARDMVRASLLRAMLNIVCHQEEDDDDL